MKDITKWITINYNNFQSNAVKRAKYLRVVIDNKLNFHKDIKVLKCKIACSVGILKKLETIILKQNLLQQYYTLAIHLNLWNHYMGLNISNLLQKLEILQNTAVKTICNALY